MYEIVESIEPEIDKWSPYAFLAREKIGMNNISC